MASLANIGLLGGRRRFVLVVGDEGAVLCACRGRDVVERRYALSPGEAEGLRALLAAAPRVGVTVMVDVLDIALQRVSLPPVAAWEVHSLLQRRMERAFPNFRCAGALAEGRAPEGRRDREFLIAGIAPSPAYDRWMAFLDSVPNRIAAITLLPVEAQPMLERLAEPLGAGRSAWQVMVSRARTGGFRQVVCERGRIAFSRLTRSLERDAPPAAVAEAIEQEFRNTLDYAKRLGLRPRDGIDLITVLSEDEKAALFRRRLPARNLLALTPFEAAARLGLGRSVAQDEGTAEVLHAAAFALRGHPRLRLLPERLARAQRGRALARRAYWLAAGVGALGVVYLAARAGEVLVLRNEVDGLESELAAARLKLAAAEAEAADMPRPPGRAAAELAAWDALRAEQVDPAPVMLRLGEALKGEARLVKLDWRLEPPVPTGRGQAAARPPRRLALVATVELTGLDDDLVRAVAAGERIVARIATAFPRFRVTLARPPVPIGPDETLRVDAGAARRATPARAPTMEVALESPAGEARR